MACKFCGRDIGHDERCPHADDIRPRSYCSICESGIFTSDEYVENDNGDLAHYECVSATRDALTWLGHEVKVMKGEL